MITQSIGIYLDQLQSQWKAVRALPWRPSPTPANRIPGESNTGGYTMSPSAIEQARATLANLRGMKEGSVSFDQTSQSQSLTAVHDSAPQIRYSTVPEDS